jgi:hypothetical protein
VEAARNTKKSAVMAPAVVVDPDRPLSSRRYRDVNMDYSGDSYGRGGISGNLGMLALG